MPDGSVMRNVPANAKKADIEKAWKKARASGAIPDKRETSFLQGLVEGAGPAVVNAGKAMEAVLPMAGFARKALGLGEYLTGMKDPLAPDAVRSQMQSMSQDSPYRGSTAGKIVGGIAATAPMMAGGGGAALQGAMGGAMLSEDSDPRSLAKNAAIGAVAGKAGEVVGKRVVAPVAERIGRTAPARYVAGLVKAPRLPNPKFTKPERVITRAAADLAPVRQNIDDAARLGLPYSLADASPELRSLGGSVSRKSNAANALAERTFAPRARAQADRAVSAIDDMLAPTTDIARRQGVLGKMGSRAAKPYYEAAFGRAAPIDDTTAAMLKTPAGKSALREAYEIAANEGKDPLAMGFDLDAQGEVILREAPSFETLDMVKRGIDTRLNDFRNPITGELNLKGNPVGQSIEGLRKRFVSHLDTMNKDYPEARAAFQKYAQRGEALVRGEKASAPNVKLRDMQRATSRLGEETMPEFQRGFATGMGDKAEGVRMTGNPYEAIYGTPRQQAKIKELFPEGAADFDRQYQLESDMSKTAWETLGGSPTQRRAMADQLFDTNIAGYSKAALEAAANPKFAALNAVGRGINDNLTVRGQQTAEELAPQLFDTTNAQGLLSFLDDLAKRKAEEEARKQAYRNGFGLLGLPLAGGAIAGSR